MVTQALSIYFTAPRQVQIRSEELPATGPGQVLVKSLLSAISSGTEMLVYRGQFPVGMAIDKEITALGGNFGYPLRYGYAVAGRVIEIGQGVDQDWKGRLVFAFQPHTSHFLAEPAGLIALPEGITPEQAVFLPNMETAVNFLMDGAPLIGEQVVVFGQGIVGLLTTALLSQFPLGRLVTLDRHPIRRQASLALGATTCLDPSAPDLNHQLQTLLPGGADLVFELSGLPETLDQAIDSTGFSGRVVIGSWYGQKRANLDLGGVFHRRRIHISSSQVTTLAPHLSGRWDKTRRFELAWEMIRRLKPEGWISQRFAQAQAAQAYQLLDENPGEAIQVVLTYTSPE